MSKSTDAVRRKKPGRPKTGIRPLLNFRASQDQITRIEVWANRHKMDRSEAIRRLIDLGLAASTSSRPHSPKAHAKSAEMAHDTLDRHADQTATPEEQARRKRRLLKGPKEFRDIRKDHK